MYKYCTNANASQFSVVVILKTSVPIIPQVAEAFKAIIYAFNVDCPPAVAADAKRKGIAVVDHNVIYKLVDDVKERISERIPKRQEEEIIGK